MSNPHREYRCTWPNGDGKEAHYHPTLKAQLWCERGKLIKNHIGRPYPKMAFLSTVEYGEVNVYEITYPGDTSKPHNMDSSVVYLAKSREHVEELFDMAWYRSKGLENFIAIREWIE